MAGKRGGKRGGVLERTSTLELLVACFGTLLVLGAFGYMAYQAINGDDSPPDITLEAGAIAAFSGGWLVRVEAHNRGGSTVARLHITGELRDGGRVIESSNAVIDYVPSHSNRFAGLFFRIDPRGRQLVLRPVGFEAP